MTIAHVMYTIPSKLMDYHSINANIDNIMGIPTSYSVFINIWLDFIFESRNIKLGVELDNVNPFSMKSSIWSTYKTLQNSLT